MAYSSRRTGRKSYGSRRAPARARVARRGTGRRRTAGRSRVSGGGSRTVRLVIETASASTVQRPPLGMALAKAPRQPSFS